MQDEEDILQLAIYATEFKVKDKVILLSTIKNIQNVLEEQETAAWQKLIRVLTHEIMNSIAPISSLSSTVETMVKPYTSGKKEMHGGGQSDDCRRSREPFKPSTSEAPD